MKVIEVNYPMAVAEAKGVKRTISLMLLPEGEVKEGDYVMVHVGNAIEKLDPEAAQEIWDALEEVLKAMDEQEGY
jgi:hydrogenase expression/formation protein HypC